MGFEETEMIANAEFPLFNSDSLPAITAHQDEPAVSTHEPMLLRPTVYAESVRNAILEPLLAGPRFQSLRNLDGTANNMSFLDNSAGAMGHTRLRTVDVQPLNHDLGYNAEVRFADVPELAGNGHGFDPHFTVNGTHSDVLPPHLWTAAPGQESDAQIATNLQLQHYVNSDDSAKRAWLLYILAGVERLTGPPDPENGSNASDQQIARINAMTSEEVHNLSDSLMESVQHQLQHLLSAAPVRETRPPLPSATQSGVALTAAQDLDATTSRHAVSGLGIDGIESSLLGHIPLGPFAPVEWSDTDFLDWNSSPDLAARAFFPEGLLATP
jgi:hypothetical protein